MSTVEHRSDASPAAVWAVLADGWTFGSWVVGASRVRAVEPDWPAVGSRVHHSVGAWPAVLDDNTEAVEAAEGERLVMLARTRPVGQARVEITLVPDGEKTLIRMTEDFVSGPATIVPSPVRGAALTARNTETLRRLSFLAQRRTRP
ncbi:Polyketide cyclase / dehydrase and lipid transport [Austwickia chelonae]|uniref:Polyketide cyclase/dehydrase n=1 Tax=Austwickia chelonae NBRC 105200 TaxID=1184607 RepID=K6V6Q1_9MICO|nr:SRPBCC family protein [Austwickia chelonae]GAB77908.1 hypothetical protein AUCHE_08_01510 [Austwickia chelonae NBRC 105200]SEV92002.1 Polyketide cyclase / dehydrase and lipid transport [Austwickia chelonae]